ncbi:MAG: hypothetical protein ACK559_01465, partial [bacterium]
MAVQGLKSIRLHCQSPHILVVVFTQHNPQPAGQAVKEQEGEKFTLLLSLGTQLRHLREKLCGLPAPKAIQRVKLLNPLVIGQLM